MTFSFQTALQQLSVEVYAVLAGALMLVLVAFFFYCRTARRLLRAVAPYNRRILPWHTWLLLLPIANIVFLLFGAERLAQSLRSEARSRGLEEDVRPVYAAGVAMGVAGALCCLPFINIFAALAFVVCWITHWVQLAVWCGKLHCENRVSACERVLYEHRPAAT